MQPSPARAMIYVVDDDSDVLGSLQFLLETDGFAVRTFMSGAALLGDDASDAADCFVIDYKMPNMNGLDLVRSLRSRDISAPIILITGHADNIPEDTLDNFNIKTVIKKPVSLIELDKTIRTVLAS